MRANRIYFYYNNCISTTILQYGRKNASILKVGYKILIFLLKFIILWKLLKLLCKIGATHGKSGPATLFVLLTY